MRQEKNSEMRPWRGQLFPKTLLKGKTQPKCVATPQTHVYNFTVAEIDETVPAPLIQNRVEELKGDFT
jgi:hypothetical protein